ncbi:MAG: hypothetical protein HS101_01175 [Planctomycetia bacterium]|jgi:hypothetical protein|nr:hypothetical protein [Planctomycetia bacterium]MCC7315674.1 hypothetical protein [Planctomycetota bacterium]
MHDRSTSDFGLGVHLPDLPTAELTIGATNRFTFRWIDFNSQDNGRESIPDRFPAR